MIRVLLFTSLGLFVGYARAADPTTAPVALDRAAAQMSLPDGFEVTLVAGEPDIVQPIAMTFDSRGRLWVVECLSYPRWTDDGTGGDRVTILEDTDGDGRHDKRKVFLDNGVNLSGIELGFGGVWLTATPNLIFVPDRDADDSPDGPPEVLLNGWDVTAQHNVFNGLIWGPDGWLYGCNGILSNSLVGAPGTPEDQRTPMNCGVWRYHPTRKVFEVVASGTTNPWGLDFDEYGQTFITNCVIKHIFHVVPGAHYERMFGQDLNPYAYTLLPSCADHIHWGGGHWTSSRSGQVHDDAGGGHAHSGCAIYLADQFPAQYRNSVFMANIHGNRLNRDVLERQEAGYVAQHAPDFLHAHDPWFRGIAVKCGPEGALYLTDWSDTGECHNYEVVDPSNGRIYRVTYGQAPTKQENLASASNQQLVAMQFDRNEWRVRQSRRLLQERASDPQTARAIVEQLLRLQPQDDRQAVRRLSALYAAGGLQALEAAGLGNHEAPQWVRFWFIQLAADQPTAWSDDLRQAIEAQLTGSTPLNRRSLSSTCQARIRSGHGDEVHNVLSHLLSHPEDGEDPLLQALNWYAVEPLVVSHPQRVLRWMPQTTMPLVRTLMARRLVTLEGGFERLAAVWRESPDGGWFSDSLRGVLQAYAGIEALPMPAVWPATYSRLQQHSDERVRHDAKLLGTIFGDATVLAGFRETLNDASADPQTRLEALEILMSRKAPQMRQTLQHLLGEPDLRTAAIRALVSLGGDDVAELLLAEYPSATAQQRQEIIQGLTTRATFAHHLLEAIDRGSIARSDVSALIIRQLQAIGDENLSRRLAEVWGEIRPISETKRELIEQYRGEFTAESLAAADLSEGQMMFNKTCGNCHKLFGQGGAIGPELTGAQRTNLDYLLDNIIDPSAIVPSNFRVVMLLLDDGRILQGVVTEENELQLKLQTATELVVVPINIIEQRQASQLSMMPEGSLEHLTIEQRRALIRYLQAPADQVKDAGLLESATPAPEHRHGT